MGCRNQSSFAENDDAHGRASLPDARNGSQGDLGAFVGVQLDPNGHCASAAFKHDKYPRQISFTRAMRTLEAFRSPLAHAPPRQLAMLYEHMLQAIAYHEIANRPNRLEPRQRKRRPKPYPLMTKPRRLARKQEAKTR